MRKFFAVLVAVLLTASVFAQSPQKMSYQAVIRNNSNVIEANKSIGMQISILQNSASGTAVYVERQFPTTNANGLVSIEIGTGIVINGNFSTINWSNGTYFIKTETDLNGGASYTITGTSQLLSIPYAFYAAKAGNGFSGSYLDLTNKPTFATIATSGSYSDLSGTPNLSSYLTSETDPIFNASATKNITATNITNWTTAFGWGNHAGLYRPISYVPAWSEITSKPNTVAGYGISNAMTTTHAANGITTTNITNWNSAFGWGNHAGLYRPISYVPIWSEVTNNPFTFATPVNNQLIKYNSTTSKWENWTPNFLTTETQNLNSVLAQGTDAGNKPIVNISQQGIGTASPSSNAILELQSTNKGFLPPRLTVLQIQNIVNPTEGLVVYNTGSKCLNVYNGTNWVDMTGNTAWIKIGDNYAGGFVFFVDGTGLHGLVCATVDQSVGGTQWGCYGTIINGADGLNIGTGLQNTLDIVNGCTSTGIAAKICYDLVLNGYSDWYLPSINELRLMYSNLLPLGKGNLYSYYWSSSEIDANNAWYANTFANFDINKNYSADLGVRAIRSF